MSQSFLTPKESKVEQSPMSETTLLGVTSKKEKISINPALLLTSLIDVFAILVIYLLVSTSDPSLNVNSPDLAKLPEAEMSTLLESGLVIRVERGKYIIDDKRVSRREIRRRLEGLTTKSNSDEKKKPAVVILTSKKSSYARVSPLVRLASEYGITQIKFAVLPKRGS